MSQAGTYIPSIPPPGPPHTDGAGPSECVLGACLRRATERRGDAGDVAACDAAAARLWALGCAPAWLHYAAAVRAYVAGETQARLFREEAA